MGAIIIRDLTTYEEFLQVRQVQQACWGFTGGVVIEPPSPRGELDLSEEGGA